MPSIEDAAQSPHEDARARFTFITALVDVDNPVSSAKTRELLGWQPTHPKLLDDLAARFYFAQP